VRFLAIQAAYQLLSDPAQRRRWDATHGPGPALGAEQAYDRSRGGPHRRPSTTRDRRPTAARRMPEAPAGAASASGRPEADDAARGRDPSQSSWTWSAAGVPWWQEGASRRSRRPAAQAGTASASAPGDRGPARPVRPEGARGPRVTDRNENGGRQGGVPSGDDGSVPSGQDTVRPRARRAGLRQAADAHGPGSPAAPDGPPRPGLDDQPDATTGGPAPGDRRPDPGMDVYARSSGAAWSAASRAYFRRVAAEIPRGARMGHSSWTGRVGWEPSAEEIARAAAERPGRRRARPTRRTAGPSPASPRAGTSAAAGSAPSPSRPTPASGAGQPLAGASESSPEAADSAAAWGRSVRGAGDSAPGAGKFPGGRAGSPGAVRVPAGDLTGRPAAFSGPTGARAAGSAKGNPAPSGPASERSGAGAGAAVARPSAAPGSSLRRLAARVARVFQA
jgi:hypothetical protein